MPPLVLGTGYLGAALVRQLCLAGETVVGMDNQFAVEASALEALQKASHGKLTLLHGDIRNPDAVARAFAAAGSVSVVYLLAAQASAHPDAASPEYSEETNLRGPRVVLEAARSHGAPPVVYASSFHVYGAPLEGTIDESAPYGAFRDLQHLSKVYVEKLGQLYANEHGVPFAPVRLGIVYGVGPVMKRDYRFVTVPHAFSLRALAAEPLRVNESGVMPAGFVHLADAVRALTSAPAPGYAPANAVGEVASVVDVAGTVEAAARARGLRPVVALPPAPGASSAFSVTTRLTAGGWRPSRTLAGSVSEILDYYAA